MAVARSGGRPPNRLAGPAPVSEAAPAPIRLVHALPPPCAEMSAAEPPAAMSEELEALPREKKRKRKRHRERADATAPSSESPPPPPTPESKPEPLTRVAPQTLAPAAAPAPAMRGGKECKRKHLEAAPPASPLSAEEEALVRKEEKRRKRRNRGEAAPATPSPSATAAAQILEVESKVAAEGETARKKRQRAAVEQEQGQSGQPPVPVVRVRSQGGVQAADGGKNGGVQSSKTSGSRRHRALSDLEIIRLRRELRKQQPGFVPAVTDPHSFVQDQDPKYSSPFGAFFDQFCYKPDRPRDRDAPQPPNSPYRATRPPPRGHPSSGSSLLNANGASKAAKTTASNAKRRRSASASTPGSQNDVKLEEKGKEKPKRKPAPLLTAAEKRSDKYRRLPLDQLVPPPRSPHKLLQEKYASDPWKVVVICMLLNLTQGKQVRKKVKGFFRRYADAQAACAADPEEMANYLQPLGLQHVKTKNIQKFSKAYDEEEWTYITELCGVGKYAADAYAIFCAGRAKEVVPKDHKLVDYWKYVCFELPSIQTSQNEQDSAGVTGLGNVVVEV